MSLSMWIFMINPILLYSIFLFSMLYYQAKGVDNNMNQQAMDAILNRRSIRQYTSQPLSTGEIKQLLTAAMSAPSCMNCRDWSFIVVTDRDMLQRMAAGNGKPAEPLKQAAAGILICGDLLRTFSKAPEYWIIDCAIAAENICIAAQAMNIGSVWLGTWPQMERVKNQSALFDLPEHIVPHSIIALGYPDGEPKPRPCIYEENRVHFETW